MDDIKQWLNGPGNWEQGVDLVLKYSQDKILRAAMLEGKTEYKEQRLRIVLAAILQSGTTNNVVREEAKKTVLQQQVAEQMTSSGKQVFKGWGPLEEMDPVVAALFKEWKPLFLEMNALQSRLHDTAKAGLTDGAKKEEAGRMAHRILDLDDRCTDIYHKRDTYRKSGALPQNITLTDDLVTDPKKWPTALQNAKRYVRDYKLKVKNNPTNAQAAQGLKKWEDRVKYYTDKLNGENG